MTPKRAIIVGASAPDTFKLISAINRSGTEQIVIEGIVDDDVRKHGSFFMGHPVLGPIAVLENIPGDLWIVNNVARDMKTRQKVARRLDGLISPERHLTLAHPSVDLSDCMVGSGCIIQEGVVLGGECQVGSHCVLYANCVIGHESEVADFVFVANNAVIGARSTIGTGVFMGINSVVLPYLTVGSWATVGAGSVVLRDVAPASTVFGNPARAGVQPKPVTAEAS